MTESTDQPTAETAGAPTAETAEEAPSRPRRGDLTRRQRRRRRQRASASSPPDRRRSRGSGTARRSEGAVRPGTTERGADRRPGSAEARRWSRPAALTVALALVLLVAAVVLAVTSGSLQWMFDREEPDAPSVTPSTLAGSDRQPSLLVVTHDAAEPSGGASGMLALAYDRETEQGTILLVPTATVADVPGHGAFQLREAFALGQAPLVDASLANLLGVRFDGYASISHDGWAALLERVGGYEIEVRSRLVGSDASGGSVRFEPGLRVLDGAELAEYLTFRTEVETELETLPRVQDVVLGLLDAINDRPEVLDAVVADGLPGLETSDPELVRTLLEQLAVARAAGRVTTVTLPVATLGTGREDSYRLDAERAEVLVADRLAASRPNDGVGVGRGVQILNGNGVPAVGQQVAERLGDGGYRIVLTGNADSFGYESTLIVIYDDSEAQLAIARDVRERLGTGEIQRSATPQSVVDVTIVVGADFPG